MSGSFERRLYCLFSDGDMTYPVFVEVQRGKPPIDPETLRVAVSERYAVPIERLELVSHPRWAERSTTAEGHVVSIGLLPNEATAE